MTHSPKPRLPPFVFTFLRHPTLQAEPFLVFVKDVGEKEALPESPQVFDVRDSSQTFGLFNLLFFLSSSCFFFFECEHQFIDKPMVTTEPAVARARLIGLGLELYPANMLGMLYKLTSLDSCRVFLEYAKIEKGKKGSAGRETLFVIYYRLYNDVFFVLFKWRVVLKMSVRLFRIKASESLEKAQEQELFPKTKTG